MSVPRDCTVLLVGSSVAHGVDYHQGGGWIYHLSIALATERYSLCVLNEAVNGGTIHSTRPILDAELERRAPLFVVIGLSIGNECLLCAASPSAAMEKASRWLSGLQELGQLAEDRGAKARAQLEPAVTSAASACLPLCHLAGRAGWRISWRLARGPLAGAAAIPRNSFDLGQQRDDQCHGPVWPLGGTRLAERNARRACDVRDPIIPQHDGSTNGSYVRAPWIGRRWREGLGGPDGTHPSPRGARAMFEQIDLTIFESSCAGASCMSHARKAFTEPPLVPGGWWLFAFVLVAGGCLRCKYLRGVGRHHGRHDRVLT